jgi:hypothetical protein
MSRLSSARARVRVLRHILVCGGGGLALSVLIALVCSHLGMAGDFGAKGIGGPPAHGQEPTVAHLQSRFDDAWPEEWPAELASWWASRDGFGLWIASARATDRPWPTSAESTAWIEEQDEDPATNPFPRSLSVTVIRAGWPVPVLQGWWMFEHGRQIPYWSGVRRTGGVLSIPGEDIESDDYIPLQPAIGGLMLSTLFWGGVVFILTGGLRPVLAAAARSERRRTVRGRIPCPAS